MIWLAVAAHAVPVDVTAQLASRTAPAAAWTNGWNPRTPTWRGPPAGLNAGIPLHINQEGQLAVLLEGGLRYDGMSWRIRPSVDLNHVEFRLGFASLMIKEPYAETRDRDATFYGVLGAGAQLAWAHFQTFPDLITPAVQAHGAMGYAIGRGSPRLLLEARLELVVRLDRYGLVAQTAGGEVTAEYWPGSGALALAAGMGFR